MSSWPDWSYKRIVTEALFDADYYVRTYPDVLAAGLNPFEHYYLTGWREMRNPSADFNTADYLMIHSDVAASGMNPLLHYATAGVAEGRATRISRRNLNKHNILYALSPQDRARDWQPVRDFDEPLSIESLRDILDERCNSAEGVILSLSHDQYKISTGGVQNCIANEERALVLAGWAYLHLSPARPLPMLARSDQTDSFSVVLTSDGRRDGVVRMADLLRVLAERNWAGREPILVVHHMLGFAVDPVIDIARLCSQQIVWVHDFFSLCPNPFLLRNDVSFCAAPPPDSGSCLVCCYGEERRLHLADFRKFFEEFEPLILSPSKTALDFWKSHSNFPHSSGQVMPAAYFLPGSPVKRTKASSAPLRVAHLGSTAEHKGWSTFRALVERHADDPRYQFYRLGIGESGVAGLTESPVDVGAGGANDMVEAVRNFDIDIVINWSNCYETFSFTTFEAMAGGAYVLARKDAGNVWPAVAAVGQGRAVRTPIELQALFISGKVVEYAQKPRTYGDLRLTNGTADLILDGAVVA